MCARACVRACVRACMRACVHACMHACMHMRVRVCGACMHGWPMHEGRDCYTPHVLWRPPSPARMRARSQGRAVLPFGGGPGQLSYLPAADVHGPSHPRRPCSPRSQRPHPFTSTPPRGRGRFDHFYFRGWKFAFTHTHGAGQRTSREEEGAAGAGAGHARPPRILRAGSTHAMDDAYARFAGELAGVGQGAGMGALPHAGMGVGLPQVRFHTRTHACHVRAHARTCARSRMREVGGRIQHPPNQPAATSRGAPHDEHCCVEPSFLGPRMQRPTLLPPLHRTCSTAHALCRMHPPHAPPPTPTPAPHPTACARSTTAACPCSPPCSP